MKKLIVSIVCILALFAGEAFAVGSTIPQVQNERWGRNYASFNAAVTAIGALPTTLIIDTALNLTSSTTTTVPATLSVEIRKGGSITKTGAGGINFSTPPFVGKFQWLIGFSVGDITGLSEINADWFGASSSAAAATNTTAIQSCIDAVTATQGTCRISVPGTYLLARQGADPARAGFYSAINMKSGGLDIGPGVILKLADGQNDDTYKVDIVSIGAYNNVHIYGGGQITGNTAGQTGWTGGYAQNTVCIIYQEITSPETSDNVVIENLTLDDYFSNPVLINSEPSDWNLTNVVLRDLRIDNVGEGPMIISAKHARMENILVKNSNNVMVGDAAELSAVDGFIVSGLTVTGTGGTGASSALDLYGSINGTASNIVVTNWPAGIAVQYSPTSGLTNNPDNIVVSGVVLKNIGSTTAGVLIDGALVSGNTVTMGRITLDNIIQNGGGSTGGVQIGASSKNILGDIKISNSQFLNTTGHGILLKYVSGVHISDTLLKGNTYDGISFYAHGTVTANNQIDNNSISNVQIIDNGRYGIKFDGQSKGYSWGVSSEGILFSNNTSGNTNYANEVVAGTQLALNESLSAPTDIKGAITSAPSYTGQFAVVSGNAYISTGITATTDWEQIDGDRALTAFTPTWTTGFTEPAIGNGTLTGYYMRTGRVVKIFIALTSGSTTSFGTGNWEFGNLPYPSSSSIYGIGSALMYDSSPSIIYTGVVQQSLGASSISVGANGTAPWVNATSPFTWAVNDTLRIEFDYVAN